MELCGEMVNMTEEQVTITIINWLKKYNWKILSYDFPQSGTGHIFKPNDDDNSRIIPDIVAIKNNICIFMENKNRFVLSDFIKQNNIKTTSIYDKSINQYLKDYNINKIYFGIGLPSKTFCDKHKQYINLVDFIIGINEQALITNLYGFDVIDADLI